MNVAQLRRQKPSPRTFGFFGVPEERLLRKVAQIGGGKIFGSEVFVVSMAFSLGDRFRSQSIAARTVEGLGYATHGWRLARAEAKAEGAA
jgi:hypothetical protein